ncbi:ATP-binding cassette domain-containing protein [Microcystis aeruginosa]|uniref:ATP-binding cassette domain-containing protein n=1 Tax=Microcystis aeruginosa TaxID=1126 RepID=UPI00232CC0F4|nr:ATP-binding cassette domain-containing protein [Microcystis aeruginosa]MDB9391095.1 ATP-binding cassette domain-containing protein [Microcystis aeruginosa CS-579]
MVSPTDTSLSPLIEVVNLQKNYGNFAAVRGINFQVYPGEIFGLIGPDGAGKTTTFHILGGVMNPSGGYVDLEGKKPRHVRQTIGYLTQQFSLYLDLSIDENLRYAANLRRVTERDWQARRDKYLTLMNLKGIGDRLAGQLSGGMKQKLALCCALISRPQILLLDEPTTGVDPVSRREFWDILATLAREGITIVVATPYLDEAERCHRIALMYEGQIHEIGTLSQLRQRLGLQRLEIRSPDIAATAEKILLLVDGQNINDVQLFGDRLDVLTGNPQQATRIIQNAIDHLSAIHPSEATLENVFVTRLRQQGSDPPFIPLPKFKSETITTGIAIDARDLRKTFANFCAVKGVTLTIDYGEIYGLLGANGAGKTTTIKMLCGLLSASDGQISLAGCSQDLRNPSLRQKIGYMSQKFTLYDDLTVIENLEFYCGVYGVPPRYRQQKIAWVLETVGLIGRETMLTGKLPGGWKQRVAFGASVMHEPEILFLDEPTSGVDPLARRQFWRLINDLARQGTAVLVTTHYLEEAEQCNRLGFMVAGEVVMQGSPSQIKAAQPGQLIELRLDRVQQAAEIFKTRLQAWRVSIFGDSLHLTLDHPDREIPEIKKIVSTAGIQVQSLRLLPFSLEDAFISVVQRINED